MESTVESLRRGLLGEMKQSLCTKYERGCRCFVPARIVNSLIQSAQAKAVQNNKK